MGDLRRAYEKARSLLGVLGRPILARHVAPARRVVAIGLPAIALAVTSVAVPEVRVYALQLMIVPILLAAAYWGAAATAALVILAAATAAVRPVPDLGQEWLVQAFVYASTALLGAVVFDQRTVLQSSSGGSQPAARDSSEERERVLESLARTVEVRDHHTQGHCRRVAKNARVLGETLGLGNSELDVLYWASLLHDVGKIAVPEYILLKNGRLTEDEFAEIRRHPGYGADLLSSVSASFRPIADVVRAHHERWDGMGYPLGYRGREIPRLARIIAVVDVFEALTSVRPYRSPMPVQQALKYLIGGQGTQFDPELVPIFCELVESGRIECGEPFDQSSLPASPAVAQGPRSVRNTLGV